MLLAHAGLIWLALHPRVTPLLSEPTEHIILASMVSELPTSVPAAQPPRLSAPLLAQPLQRPLPRPSATPAVFAAHSPATTATAAEASSAPPAPATAMSAPAQTAARPAPPAVVLPSSDADYLNNPPPSYPRMSRRMGEQGTVVLRVLINTEGRAEQAEVRTSSGYTRLDETALETVRRWRYVPGKRAGVAEAMWFNVPVRFVLD